MLPVNKMTSPNFGHLVAKFLSVPLVSVKPKMHWGVIFWRGSLDPTLPDWAFNYILAPADLPSFPDPTHPQELIGFVDTAHANDLRNR